VKYACFRVLRGIKKVDLVKNTGGFINTAPKHIRCFY
ncbi:MAG: hypothetical protein ACI8RD_014001, partial [Bacillariaceae sp.]